MKRANGTFTEDDEYFQEGIVDKEALLEGIYQELKTLNQYLQVIVKEVQDMNRGIIIKDDNE